jgi:tetratricopeptide (TPR) repeat protein
VIASNPAKPEGYFFDAMTAWWAINIDRDNDALYDEFYKKVDKVEEVCDKILDKNEDEPDALFYKGGALGYRGLVYSLKDSWLKAAQDGKSALNLLDRANEINPNNPDVKFGLGIYNYFAEFVPDKYPVIKPLMIIFPQGDKLKGLAQIKDISNNSRYARTEAKFILAYLYSVYEKNYAESQFYAQELVVAYPSNAFFRQLLCRSYIGLSNWQGAIDGWSQVLALCDSNIFGFSEKVRREAHYYLGVSYLWQRNLTEAEKNLLKAEELSKKLDKEPTEIAADGWLKLAMVYDLMGNKGKADDYYNKVISQGGFSGLREQAERWKRDRYR